MTKFTEYVYAKETLSPNYKKGEEVCPECLKGTLRGKELWEGGGVTCRDKHCGYWFCF